MQPELFSFNCEQMFKKNNKKKELLHREGINLRFLGLIRNTISSNESGSGSESFDDLESSLSDSGFFLFIFLFFFFLF